MGLPHTGSRTVVVLLACLKRGAWDMSERYKEEIEEILQGQTGRLEGKASKRRGAFWGRLGRGSALSLLRPGRVLAASLVLLLLGFVVRGPHAIFLWLGLLAFITAYAMFFVRWGSKPEKRWRGRAVDDRGRGSWSARLRRRFPF